MADPINLVPEAETVKLEEPSAREEWERLLQALHRHGVLSALADLAEQSDVVTEMLLKRLEAPVAERRLRDVLALLIPPSEADAVEKGPGGGMSGLLRLWRTLRERQVQKGLYRLLHMVRRLGQIDGGG